MPRITLHVGGHKHLEPAISKATPMGALGTDAIVRLGPTLITGSAPALRAWPTPWSKPRIWPTTTTPTPTPTTSASRSGPSVTATGELTRRRPQPGTAHQGRRPGRRRHTQHRPAHITRARSVMCQPSNHATAVNGTASHQVAALERTWQTIRSRHPDVPEAVLVVASGAKGKRLNLGHFAPHRWQVAGSDRHEVLIGGEGLQRGPIDVLGTLLHEAAHGLAQARGVQDTSRQGRYHNRRYATLARELGLQVASVQPIGWSATTVPDTSAAAYAGQLEDLAAALVLWRRHEHRIGAGLALATCSPPPAAAAAASASPRPPWPRRPSSAASAPSRSNLTTRAVDV